MLADTPVPAPRSLALDADGRHVRVPRAPDDPAAGPRSTPTASTTSSLDQLAELLATIHEVSPTIEVRTYQSWAWEAKYAVPSWATDPDLWQDAFALLRTDAPDVRAALHPPRLPACATSSGPTAG